jgi:malate dehydrogenase (oxaloacetate-decarboxylating)
VNEEVKLAAAEAIAHRVKSDELHEDYIIPSPFEKRVVHAVAHAVAEAARKTGLAEK